MVIQWNRLLDLGWCGGGRLVICSTGPGLPCTRVAQHWPAAGQPHPCGEVCIAREATWRFRLRNVLKKKKKTLKKKDLRNQELKIMRKSTVAPLQRCRLRVESFWLIPRAQNNQLAAVNQCHNCPANNCFCRPVFGEFRRSKLQSDYCPS